MNAKKNKKENKAKLVTIIDPSELEILEINGSEYRTLYTGKYRNRKQWEAPDPKKILSYIPGTILEVYVKEGQKVKEGDPLVILEAMKMRNKVVVMEEGVVKSVNVEVGDKIPKGRLIVEME